MKESVITGPKHFHLTKGGGSKTGQPWTLKSGGSSRAALQKFMPVIIYSKFAVM